MRLEFVGRGEDETALRIDVAAVVQIEFLVKEVDAGQTKGRSVHLPGDGGVDDEYISVVIRRGRF